MIDGFKKYSMKFLAIFIMTLMLLSIVNMPVTYAYFTSNEESEPITLKIKAGNPDTSNASAVFNDSFLKEGEGEVSLQGSTSTRSLDSFSEEETRLQGSADSSTESLSSTEHETNIELTAEDEEYFQSTLIEEKEIQLEIELLDEGFHAGDIYVPSLTLEHDENSTTVLSGELKEDRLVVTFDREEVSSWFDGLKDGNKEIVFTVAGEGYKDGLHLFEFSTEAKIKLYGEFETRLIAIKGHESIVIPPNEQEVSNTFILINQDGKELEDPQWGIENVVDGVDLDSETGKLAIDDTAEAGEIMITAEIEREERLLTNKKQVELLEAPEAQLKGPYELTAPLPGESLTETYDLEMPDDFQAEELTWELEEEVEGVSLSEDGEITLSGEPEEEKFTILASYHLEDLQLEAEKTVDIEVIRIGSVEISAKYDEDTFTIPEEAEELENGEDDEDTEGTGATDEKENSGEPLVLEHDAEVFDLVEEKLPEEKVEWLLDADRTRGLELTQNGDLIVDSSAQPGELIIEAYSLRDAEVYDTKTLTLEAPPEEKLDEKEEEDSTVDEGRGGENLEKDTLPALTVKGDELLLIPSEGEKTVIYHAEDKQGDTPEDITWKISNEKEEEAKEEAEEKEKKPEGVSFDAKTGTLTIDHTAEESSFTLEALLEIPLEEDEEDSEDDNKQIETLTDSIEIELLYPTPRSIEVERPDNIYIPFTADEETTKETYTLEADVLNQKGGVMEEESVTWSLVEEVSGAALSESGELTVNSDAESGTITVMVQTECDPQIDKEIEIPLDFDPDAEDEKPEEVCKEEEEPKAKGEDEDEDDEDEEDEDEEKGEEHQEEDDEEKEDDNSDDDESIEDEKKGKDDESDESDDGDDSDGKEEDENGDKDDEDDEEDDNDKNGDDEKEEEKEEEKEGDEKAKEEDEDDVKEDEEDKNADSEDDDDEEDNDDYDKNENDDNGDENENGDNDDDAKKDEDDEEEDNNGDEDEDEDENEDEESDENEDTDNDDEGKDDNGEDNDNDGDNDDDEDKDKGTDDDGNDGDDDKNDKDDD